MQTRELTIQLHNELRDLKVDDVEVEPVLQEITGKDLPRGSDKAPDTRLDIHARGFW